MGDVIAIKSKETIHKDPASPAKILYCGHSAIIITTETGKRVAIDPFLAGNPRCPKELHDPGKIDFIILTHGHSDHVGSTLTLAKKYHSTVFANYELCVLLVKDGLSENQVQFMNKGGTVSIPNTDLKVTLTHAYHSASYDATDGKTYYAGEPCGVVLQLESGRTIYDAGDTALFSDMQLIHDEFHPQVAFLPIGNRFTMGPKTAAKAAALIKPKVVIPIHYATFEMLSGTAEEFESAMKGQEAKVQILEPGEEIQF